jgi:hypothetical protein
MVQGPHAISARHGRVFHCRTQPVVTFAALPKELADALKDHVDEVEIPAKATRPRDGGTKPE